MVINDILAYRLGKLYEKNAIKEAENARLVKMALQHRKKQSLMKWVMQRVQDQWEGVLSINGREKLQHSGSTLPPQQVTKTR